MKRGNSSNCVHWLYAVRTGTCTSMLCSMVAMWAPPLAKRSLAERPRERGSKITATPTEGAEPPRLEGSVAADGLPGRGGRVVRALRSFRRGQRHPADGGGGPDQVIPVHPLAQEQPGQPDHQEGDQVHEY